MIVMFVSRKLGRHLIFHAHSRVNGMISKISCGRGRFVTFTAACGVPWRHVIEGHTNSYIIIMIKLDQK